MSETYDIGKAHQKTIREERSDNAASENLFGAWWEDIDTDIKKAEIREISYATAEAVILEYEWLGCMPAMVEICYGIYWGDACGGVVVYGTEYSENLGTWDKYDYSGKIILLARGACVHWAHPHSGSKLIRESMKMLPDRYEVVTCTTDHAAGEIGTIYQACGFDYVGSMRESNPNVKSKKLDRLGVKINGKIYGSRAIRQKIGSQKKENILKHWPDAEFVPQHSKHRYFAFRGSKVQKKNNRKAIAHLVKPYPKRK